MLLEAPASRQKLQCLVLAMSIGVLGAFSCMTAYAGSGDVSAESVFGDHAGAVPVPPAERGLPAAEARMVRAVGDRWQTLEGALLEQSGDLLFCNVSEGRVMRLSGDGRLCTVLEVRDFAPGGLARHRDGRLFVAGINQEKGNGGIIALSPDGTSTETIIAPSAGFMPNDLVFDRHGGFYFTDFRGSATRAAGGVYYVSPDFGSIKPVIPNMAQANGVALSPDGKTLWATEYARNLLHRVSLAGPVEVPLTGSKIPYHFIGPAPDSMRVDANGNVYVAMVGQGRVMIFNPAGIPIGQVLLPGRDAGLNLRSTSLALHPLKREMMIVAGNVKDAPSGDAVIFAAPAFARAFSQ